MVLQIAAGAQQVGGEGMAQRMRRHAVGAGRAGGGCRARASARSRDRAAAAGADEEGIVGPGAPQSGAGVAVGRQRLERLRQQRHQPRLVALAGDAERVLARRQQALDGGLGEAERLADAQARAIEQQQDGGVAQVDPGLALLLGRRRRAARSMSRSVSALGTERGSLGVWMAPMLALWASPRLSRKRKKERTEEKARAVEVRAMPRRARSASQARNSAGFSLPSAVERRRGCRDSRS